MYRVGIPAEDINKDAQYLGITLEKFIDAYLEKDEYGMNYQTKHEQYDFLQEYGNSKLEDCKLDSCKNIHIPTSWRECQVYWVYWIL